MGCCVSTQAVEALSPRRAALVYSDIEHSVTSGTMLGPSTESLLDTPPRAQPPALPAAKSPTPPAAMSPTIVPSTITSSVAAATSPTITPPVAASGAAVAPERTRESILKYEIKRIQMTKIPLWPTSPYALGELIGKTDGAAIYGVRGYALVIKQVVIDYDINYPSNAEFECVAQKMCSNHPNIVKIVDCWRTPPLTNAASPCQTGTIYNLLLERADETLERVMSRFDEPPPAALLRTWMRDILHGLAHIHAAGLVHHDLKPQNILVFKRARAIVSDVKTDLKAEPDQPPILKICDFGLASVNGKPCFGRPQTLWYRAPEMHVRVVEGVFMTDPAADMWSLGCLFVEIISGQPLFPVYEDDHLLDAIFSVLGVPEEKDCPYIRGLPAGAYTRKDPRPKQIPLTFGAEYADIAPLINQMLDLRPAHRVTAQQCLDSKKFG